MFDYLDGALLDNTIIRLSVLNHDFYFSLAYLCSNVNLFKGGGGVDELCEERACLVRVKVGSCKELYIL